MTPTRKQRAFLKVAPLALSVLGTFGATTAHAESLAPGDPAATALSPRKEDKKNALNTFKVRHEKVIALVKRKASTAKIQAEVDKLLDYRWIAQAALGGKSKYAGACANRCSEFEALLTRLIRENYLRLIRKAEGREVEYVSQAQGRRNAYLVKTRVTVNKNGRMKKMVVAYVMHEQEGNWQVRDIITEDLSLAKTYRYEFNRALKRDGIDAVIQMLESKLNELASK